MRGGGNAGGPINDTSRARKGGSITAIVSANTGSDAGKNRPA
jgi:hypothetical protein